jgi:hypothetical protein
MMNFNVWIHLEYNAKYLHSQVFSAPALIFPLVFDIEKNQLVSLRIELIPFQLPTGECVLYKEDVRYFHIHFSDLIKEKLLPY